MQIPLASNKKLRDKHVTRPFLQNGRETLDCRSLSATLRGVGPLSDSRRRNAAVGKRQRSPVTQKPSVPAEGFCFSCIRNQFMIVPGCLVKSMIFNGSLLGKS